MSIDKNTNPIAIFFKGIRNEWGKISWPQRPQIISETIIVFVVTTLFTIAVYLLDLIFEGVLGLIA